MEILATIILILASIIGVILTIFAAFGNLVILGGIGLYALMTNFAVINYKILIVITIIYLFGELLEYIAVTFGAKKLGASNKAIVGAIIGGILGAVFGAGFAGIGAFFGAFLGVFLGAFIIELIFEKDFKQSVKSGLGGVLGRLGAMVGKLAIALVMISICVYKIIVS